MDSKEKIYPLRRDIEVAACIKGKGFRVFVPEDPQKTFGFFSDGKHVGYFQISEHVPEISLATCGKNPGSTGHGLLIENNGGSVPLEKLTKEYLQKAFLLHPEYLSEKDQKRMPNNPFSSLEEFLKNNRELKLKEL